MASRVYQTTRDLHLYLGLFLSPFVLLFAVSVFYLVHVSLYPKPTESPGRLVTNLSIPPELEQLTGREQVHALRPVLDQLAVHGEINFIRRIAKERRLVVPVTVPGSETTVDLNLASQSATITVRHTGTADALVYLHKMPGPHNVNIRANATFMQAWKILTDFTAYGLLFLTFSGIYLWAVLKAERNIGIALIGLGAISFFGLVYAIAS